MILIIEGADRVGKTTLAKRCAAAYNLPLAKIRWRLGKHGELETLAMAAATVEILRVTHTSIVFDRIYFSWWAYGPALGRGVAFMPTVIADFAEVRDARLILLTASDEEITRRYQQKPDMVFPLDVILAANARYPSLLPLLPATLPYLHIDTSTADQDETFAQADAFIRKMNV